jgi:hypothetical protein
MARLRCAVASLLLVGLHASVLRRPQPTTPGRLALEPLMHLRGGGDATADDHPPTAEPVSCWSAVQKLLGFLRKMLVPNHEHAKAEQRGIAEETPEQSTGYAPDDDSWRTQRKKLNQVELPPAARKRVLRDLRRMKAHDDELLSLEDSECLTDWVIKLVGAPGTSGVQNAESPLGGPGPAHARRRATSGRLAAVASAARLRPPRRR